MSLLETNDLSAGDEVEEREEEIPISFTGNLSTAVGGDQEPLSLLPIPPESLGRRTTTTERIYSENEISPNKKVDFSPEVVRMEQGGSTNKRREGSASATTNTAGNGTFISTKRRSSPSGALMNEIRKMSLASQDEKAEKKSSSSTKKIPRRFGRRRKRKEEEYTDKDRAAAVTLGSRDIKQSLKAKKKRERKLCLSLELMNSEDFLTTMLINEAMAQLRLKKPNVALATLNKALELQPHNKGALVARSQCHLKLGEAELALKDAETTFDKKDTYIMGLFLYAEALYNLGHFERALISYHRGFRLRQDMTGFRIGVQKCQEAIQRAIGDHKATQIDDLDAILPMIDEIEALKNQRKSETTLPHGKDEEAYKRKMGNKLKIQSKTRARWVERECLGQMFLDKDYFAKFIGRPDILNGDGAASQLKTNANDALNYFEIRQQFWRQQNPIYSRRVGLNTNSNVILQYEEQEKERHEVSRLTKSISDEGPAIRQNNLRQENNYSGRKTSTPSAVSAKPGLDK